MEDRLMRCFSSVFPAASRDEISSQSLEEITGWDSLRVVTLLAVLDEQFGVQMEVPDLLELGTFSAIKEFVLQRTNGQ